MQYALTVAIQIWYILRIIRGETHMKNEETAEGFSCVECRHSLRARQDDHKVICALTLELKDRDNPASCEYAEHQGGDGRGNNSGY